MMVGYLEKWILLVVGLSKCLGCTDILITPESTQDGSAMIAYNADSGALMGLLYHYPPTSGLGGQMRKVYDWDSGRYLGEIPEANQTFNVVGNVNEYGLCIGESTFGGIMEAQKGAILDYGSLIWITLQRCKTAREAIQTMGSLMDTYGYASEGESFSIADRSGEVWIMEVIGRGTTYGKLGAVWVARRIPLGYITSHANQARITTFPRDDPDNCMYAQDVVDVAVHYGFFSKDADPNTFSFSDVYAPVNFGSARMSEARVWSIFSELVNDNDVFREEYLEYASGRNTTHRMPLWIKPNKKLSLLDVMQAMNSHYEGTELDSSADVGSGLYGAPYRPRPLEWEYDGKHYHNERTVGTHQTGWNFIAQIRSNTPRELSGLIWFAVDDSSTSPRVPVYASSRKTSGAYGGKGAQDGVVTPLLKFDIKKAFWVQNMVSNFAYTRWSDIYPIVRTRIDGLMQDFMEEVARTDDRALELYKTMGPDIAIEFITLKTVYWGDSLTEEWWQFYGELFARFRDFFTVVPKKGEPSCGCEVKELGMTEASRERITKETKGHYQIPDDGVTISKSKA